MSRSRSFLFVVAIALACAVTFSSEVDASHYRGGNASWVLTSSQTVQFTVITSWRASFVDVFLRRFGDGTALPSGFPPGLFLGQFTDSTGRQYRSYRRIFTHTYLGPGPYVADLDNCCRIFGLGNASSGPYRLQVVVDFRGGSLGSPATSAPAILQMQQGIFNSITLPVSDPDGDFVSCRLANVAESGIPFHPPWLAASAVAGGCALTGDGLHASVFPGQLWAAAVILEDAAGAQSAADFIIEILPLSSLPPTCSGSGNYVVPVGTSTQVCLVGTDPESGPLLSQYLNPAPGASFGPTAGPSPLTSCINWTATGIDQGQSYAGTVIMRDDSNLQGLCGVTFSVPVCDDIDSDNVCDVEDNCVGTSNPSQTDSDNDGAGDACDVCPMDPRDILEDTHPPIFIGPSLPPDEVAECDALPDLPPPPIAFDTCPSYPVSVSHEGSTIGDPSSGVYTILNTWTATDAAGNSTDYTQTVQVVDSGAPLLSCPGPFTVEQAGLAGTPVPFACLASDNCSAVDVVDDAPSVYPLGTTQVTVTATDQAGNSTNAQVTVTVVDTTPPTLGVAGPEGYVCGEEAVLLAVSSDACDASPSVVFDPAPDSVSQVGDEYTARYGAEGVYSVDVSSTDFSGNAAAQSVGPFAVDGTAPEEDFGSVLDQSAVVPGDPSTYPVLYNSSDLLVALTASDPAPSGDLAASGLASVQVILDGSELLISDTFVADRGLMGSGGPLEALVQCDLDPRCDGAGVLNLAEVSDGDHRITVVLEDYACNLTEKDYYFRSTPVPADFWCVPESVNVSSCGNWINCWVKLTSEADDLGNLPPDSSWIAPGTVHVLNNWQFLPKVIDAPEDVSWPGHPGTVDVEHGYHFKPERGDPALDGMDDGLAPQIVSSLEMLPGQRDALDLCVCGDLFGGGSFLSNLESGAGGTGAPRPTEVHYRGNQNCGW
jgi:hypothetical protein